ncbi:MAG: NTP transferase domain-containing protein [Fimbriimonadaceae bacterium]|nr:NTP transferase domain-containing protein [Fimbriimonadaceae bacterium]
MKQAAVILAAGKGTRMNSELPKVLHRAAGRPLVEWVVQACRGAGIDDVVLIVGYQEHLVREALAAQGVRFARQAEQQGTGHAAAQAREAVGEEPGLVFVLNGDSPLIDAAVLTAMRETHLRRQADATLLYVVPPQPLEYGRLIRKPDGDLSDVIEERDCTPEQRAIRELNAGFYLFNAPQIWQVLGELKNDNKAGEYYITDVPRHLARHGGVVVPQEAPAAMALGVNTPAQLAEVETILQRRGLGAK